MSWLWQGTFTSILGALFMIACGALFALLKRRGSQWLGVALHGLIGCTLAAVCLFAFASFTALPQRTLLVTPENAETTLRAWLDSFGLSVKRESDPESHFALVVTLSNSTQVAITRPKRQQSYVMFQSLLAVSREHEAMLTRLSEDARDEVLRELVLELARARIGNVLQGPELLKSVRVVRSVPITSLSEESLARLLDEIDSGVQLARQAIVLSLYRRSRDTRATASTQPAQRR